MSAITIPIRTVPLSLAESDRSESRQFIGCVAARGVVQRESSTLYKMPDALRSRLIGIAPHSDRAGQWGMSTADELMPRPGQREMRCAKTRVKTTALVALVLFSLLLIFLAALLIRTYTFPAEQQAAIGHRAALTANFSLSERRVMLDNFRGALRIATVSRGVSDFNTSALREFGDHLSQVFPNVFSSPVVHHETVANYSHLFTVSGSNDSLQPYILIAHLDVVPAVEEEWEVPPFSAEERNGYLYARGSLDDKLSVMGILQSLELLLERGYKPHRSFYIGLGHDEEVGGYNGARNIATVLQSRGVKLAYLLDEGSAIFDEIIPGLEKQVAMIATSEKSSATIGLSVTTTSGHSSIPPKETSIGILAAAVSRLERNPMPRMFGQGPERGLFEHLTPQLPFPLNMVMANLWLFAPLVSRIMEKKPSTNSLVRTTTAVTEFHAGIKANVIASSARAIVNFRLHPAHRLEELLQQIQHIISDERVKIEVLESSPPIPMSSYDDDAFGYQVIKATIGNIFPDVTVTPGLCIASTDTKHYQNLTTELYRFTPIILKEEDISRVHGVNERISVKNYEEVVQFYFTLIQNSDS
ncbi:N-fatty-acyl-amino acid synthase/hydrolase PM20D1-like isoform X1 [Hypanus sabinus]|uniref:N-fatty-acyl-amino acid synthase/hydrolase PM20D1-like isoform X1 n=1 Tax=Hypanus sabinus TaxID=79690 RepID=UPI0028C43F4A|nr:N-fatty-acyl-amino acid synthase/hydrolase PM20D1-like isoform X1 [Hypanus sabinus]